ncbi:hypothetical protein JAAARDRAFT_160672 [Jaapia argillacea MUCL 33604]|uniref:G domain-containing protein n=1 Tax=Jaapia argillacea MUCL 33604 TaxID=933084 RepID=A0A067PII4_9AGAM|nr:hypothetical protein JAAARDRAFT_160672 [Jaapia argillacea MUCL 33604]
MGATGTGKSSFIHSLTNNKNIVVGHTLNSETSDIKCARYFVPNSSACVTFIDTPGFDDSRGHAAGMGDTDILRKIATFLKVEYEQKQKLAGVIYMHRINDTRMSNSSQRNLRMFRNLCGSESMKNVVIVTTMWDSAPRKQAEMHEAELRTKCGFFKDLIDDGAQLVRSGQYCEGEGFLPPSQIVSDILLRSQPVFTQIQNEMAQGKELDCTSAGEQLDTDLRKMKQHFEMEMKKLQEETEEAIKDRDSRAVRELEEEKTKNRLEVEKLDKQLRALQEGLRVSKADMQKIILEEQQERGRQRAESGEDDGDFFAGALVGATGVYFMTNALSSFV